MMKRITIALSMIGLFSLLIGGVIMTTPKQPGPYAGVVVLRHNDESAGSGFVFEASRFYWFVGTAAHVVQDIDFIDVDDVRAEVIARNDDLDIAIVRVRRNEQNYRVYGFAEAKLEDPIRAVGYTWGNGWENDPTFMVYRARVTCLNWESCLASNCGAYPGMSGGPLLDAKGRVIGITSRCASAWSTPITTLSVFVPVAQLEKLWNEYLEGE